VKSNLGLLKALFCHLPREVEKQYTEFNYIRYPGRELNNGPLKCYHPLATFARGTDREINSPLFLLQELKYCSHILILHAFKTQFLKAPRRGFILEDLSIVLLQQARSN